MSSQSDPVLEPLVRKLSYWTEFDADDRQAILDLPWRTKRLGRRQYIAREQEAVTQSCVLLEGFAIQLKMVAGGARQITAVHMKGDLLDIQNAFFGVADHSIQALTDINIAYIPAEAVKKLAFERPAVGMALWLDTLVAGSICREWIVNVGRRNAQTRIAHLLCEFALRIEVAGLGEATRYEMPMTQEEIGDCTGLTPVHVNRTLKCLEAAKLIERRSGRFVTIDDWIRLGDAADFDSSYLHLHENKPRSTGRSGLNKLSRSSGSHQVGIGADECPTSANPDVLGSVQTFTQHQRTA